MFRPPHPRAAAAAFLLLFACSSVESAPQAGSNSSGDMGGDVGDGDGDGDGDGTSTGDGSSGDGDGDGDGDEGVDLGGSEQECDPWEQDCPEGEKCSWYFDGYEPATRCIPIAPEPKMPGEKCQVEEDQWSGIDDCQAGSVCEFVDENGNGICVELCEGSPEDPTCADPDAMCQLCNDECASLCLPTCDPLEPTCHEGQVCTPTVDGPFVCTPGGSNDGVGGFGDTCEYANECENGFACVQAELVPGCKGTFCCTVYCDLNEDMPCPEELECMPWENKNENIPDEYKDVGVCTLP